MARIQVPLNGITTTSAYPDGDSYSLVNLRPKNGALHPVPPRKVMQELSQDYDIVFVHRTSEYENWIGVINQNYNASIFWDILSNNPKPLYSNYGIREKINSVEQIGNTLSLITDSNIYYLLFINGSYTFLGELPDLPSIGFKTSDRMAKAQYYFKNEYGDGTVTPENFIDSTKGLVYKAIDMLVNGGADKDGKPVGGYGLHLFDAHFVRYAFRLFDGSLTKHSPPILIMPVRSIVGSEDEGAVDSIKTISYDFDKTLRAESYVEVYGYKIYVNYNFNQLGEVEYTRWTDIIKSVDIFISQPLGLSNIESIRRDMPTTDNPRSLKYNLIKGMPPEALKNIENTSTFYFIRSINLGKSSLEIGEEPIIPSTKSDISKMENLIYQEVMSDDQFSHHKQGAEVSYTYNNRLHLANIKTTFFNGFKPDFFIWENTSEVGPDGEAPQSYNGYKYAEAPGQSIGTFIFEVDIAVGAALQKVYSYSSNSIHGMYKMFFSPFISYPDSRAQRLTIYEEDYSGRWTRLFSSNLERHNLLNISFYLNEGLVPVVADRRDSANKPNTSKAITLSENKIKVSELNNPMVFPNANTYQAGNGYVLAMATNAMNVSDRNFGQYPLYIFTTQGIWALNIGDGEVAYSTKSSPATKEVPNTKVVCETPFGVVFTTEEGLKIINGDNVEFLSPQIQHAYSDINIELPESHCKGLVLLNNNQSFTEYLAEVNSIIFDLEERELIISKRDADYSYVLNINTQSFYQTTEKIDLHVRNIFPELKVIGGRQLKDFTKINSDKVHISLATRPISLGTSDIKYLERVIMRSLLKEIQNQGEKKSVIMLHGSNDAVNFPALRGLTSDPCNRKDYDMGMFASSKRRFYTFIFAGVVDKSSKLYYLDIEIRKEYDNTKMR